MDEFMEYEQNTQLEMPVPKKKKKTGLWVLVILLILAVAAVAAFFLTADLRGYDRAQTLYAEGNYELAAQAFEELGDYEDAPEMAQNATYAWAMELMDQAQYTQALDVLAPLGDYKATAYRIQQCHFALGQEAMDAEDYDTAITHFSQAQTTGAAPQRLKDAIYARGHELFWDGDHAQAQEYFDRLEGDWPLNCGPHFETLDEALDYLQAQAETMAERITVVVKDIPGTYIMTEGYLELAIRQHMGYQTSRYAFDEDSGVITVAPYYYPGQRIVYAWKNGDTSILSEAELQTYELALDLVAQAQAVSGDIIDTELWLHDWICDHVTYENPDMDVPTEEFLQLRELTCVGALLDGVANCQGYTDAFYVLGNMAGLDVCRVFGTSEDGHCWNGVRLDDWLYTVDVTFNDTLTEELGLNTYIWFNNALDLDEYEVWGGSIMFYRMVTRQDHTYTYYGRTDNVYEDLDDAVYGLLRMYRQNGKGVYNVVAEGADWDADDFYDAVGDNMGALGIYSIQWSVLITPYLGDSYICVEWM